VKIIYFVHFKEVKIMKAKVRLSYEVTLFVEGPSEEAIQEWLSCHTPDEVRELTGGKVEESYDEEIICPIVENSIVDYVIKED
jgi:hypothetical protein